MYLKENWKVFENFDEMDIVFIMNFVFLVLVYHFVVIVVVFVIKIVVA